jgi:hypothetical protein
MSTSYHQVNSSASHEGDLKGEWFAGNHGPEGAFASLKGPALTPPELSFSVQDTNYNDGRVDSNGMAPVPHGWAASVVTTGLTGPGGTLAK